mmetsp:Transcript_11466/g.36634  ORF Transcript_11466/g.36634 Transcript_11466/m.36634 type:complete len:285 (-) Transcript_11466:183-1037(-)
MSSHAAGSNGYSEGRLCRLRVDELRGFLRRGQQVQIHADAVCSECLTHHILPSFAGVHEVLVLHHRPLVLLNVVQPDAVRKIGRPFACMVPRALRRVSQVRAVPDLLSSDGVVRGGGPTAWPTPTAGRRRGRPGSREARGRKARQGTASTRARGCAHEGGRREGARLDLVVGGAGQDSLWRVHRRRCPHAQRVAELWCSVLQLRRPRRTARHRPHLHLASLPCRRWQRVSVMARRSTALRRWRCSTGDLYTGLARPWEEAIGRVGHGLVTVHAGGGMPAPEAKP